jgi:hypothetical protein
MAYRYVAMLRSKAGEVTALEHLAVQARQRLLPVVHLVATPPPTFVQRLPAAWDRPVGIDGLFNYSTSGSAHTFTSIVQTLRQAGMTVSPTVESDADPGYVQAVGKLVTVKHPNVVVKVALRDLPTIDTWVRRHGWAPGNVDLVISVGHIAEFATRDFAPFVEHSIKNNLPNPGSWLSVTLASSSAPKDYSALAPGRNVVPRLCWALWQHVYQKVTGFQLDFGDYAIAHPDLTEPPGVAMVRASVSVRYAVDDSWIVLKGRSTTGAAGQSMRTQYTAHARALQKERQFNRLPGCWGDQRITAIATTPGVGSGSRQTWVEIGVNRHISLVADRLP